MSDEKGALLKLEHLKLNVQTALRFATVTHYFINCLEARLGGKKSGMAGEIYP